MESTDCVQGTTSLEQGEHDETQRTPPHTNKHPPMLIRSARIANQEPSMSGDGTPDHTSPSSPPHAQNNKRPVVPLSHAISDLIQSSRQQRLHLQPEVSTDLLQRTLLHPITTPVPAISVIIAEGLLTEPQSTFADVVGSLSPSAMLRRSSLVSNITSPDRPSVTEGSSQPQSSSALTAASASRRRTDKRELSGTTLSMPLRQSGSNTARSRFPAKTVMPMTSGTTMGTTTSCPSITAVHTSTYSLSTEPQASESTHTNQGPAVIRDEHRASIQTTVNELGELVEHFRALNFNGRDCFFQQIITTIPPTTRTCHNAVGRRGPTASEVLMQAQPEAQQDSGGMEAPVDSSAATERSVWQPVL